MLYIVLSMIPAEGFIFDTSGSGACSIEIYGIEDEKGLFEPSISLEEMDEARGLIFCISGHIVTLIGATEGIFEFRFRSRDTGCP